MEKNVNAVFISFRYLKLVLNNNNLTYFKEPKNIQSDTQPFAPTNSRG